MRSFCLILLCLSLSASAGWGLGQRPSARPTQDIGIGKPAPDFRLADLGGREVRLSQFRGKVVFLNFWASWCPPCRSEMPSMERLNEVFQSRDFVMLAVNTENDPEAVKKYLKKNPHKFRVLLDIDGKVHTSYQVFKFPETFLIDKSGRIAHHYLGARDWSSMTFMKKIRGMIEGESR